MFVSLDPFLDLTSLQTSMDEKTNPYRYMVCVFLIAGLMAVHNPNL